MTYPWEKLAKTNQPMPEGLALTDQMAFQCLAMLTARYRAGYLGGEQAMKERKEIDRAYAIRLAGDQAAQWMAEFRTKIEIAHSRYRLNPTTENAKLLSDVIDGFVRI